MSTDSRPIDVLVVSEDPGVLRTAAKELRARDLDLVGCLGPAHSDCLLDTKGSCSLAAHSRVAVVDSPASGSFQCHWKVAPAGEYAERLARRYPGCLVLLCGAPEGPSGPAGEVVNMSSTASALALISELHLRSDLAVRAAGQEEGRNESQ